MAILISPSIIKIGQESQVMVIVVVATWDIRSLNRPFASVRYLAFITFLGECMELPRKSRTGIPILSTRS